MDIFTQKKILVRVIIFLVLINVGSIGVFFWKSSVEKDYLERQSLNNENRTERPDHPERYGGDENKHRDERNGELRLSDEQKELAHILEDQLGLTEKQSEQIRDIRESFFEREKILEATIRSERDSMNMEMFNKGTDNEHLKILALHVSENEYKMELLRIEQAQQLKAICTPKQLEKLNSLVTEIRDYFRPDNRPTRGRPDRE